MSKFYLVTGATGHVGNALLRRMHREGLNIRAFVLPNEKEASILKEVNAEVFAGDVRKPETLDAFFAHGKDDELVVVHAAGIVTIASRREKIVYEVNVQGTQNIIDKCVENDVEKLIYVSSVHAIPVLPKGETMGEVADFNPDKVKGYYAKTKAEASAAVLKAVRERGLRACIVHPSGIIGPYDDVGRNHITQMVKDYLRNKLPMGVDGGYDFVDVRDVAEGIMACIEKGEIGECYLLSNKFVTVREIMTELHNATGKKKIKFMAPIWLCKIFSPLAELYYRLAKQPPLFTSYSMYTLSSNAVFSHEKADKKLGYKTIPIMTSIKDTVGWLKEHNRV